MPIQLRDLLPAPGERLGSDEILNRFMSWVADSGLGLYDAQEEAILELLAGKHVILNTPTGSGKSLVATALHFQALCTGKVSYYTCPIKALANEKFFALCDIFGAERVGMVTGDATINREAPILCCTAEVLSNLALRDPELRADMVVMDEFHYYGDKERGVAWQVPLLALTQARFLLMSATLGDTSTIEKSLHELTGVEVAVVASKKRPVPLEFVWRETPLHETIADLVGKNLAPVYLVSFTQRAAAEEAQNLTSVELLTKTEKETVKEMLYEARFDTPYGKELQRFLRHGVGIHHAGLLPKYRLLVEKMAQRGLLKIVSGTDTLGMGINIPLKTVLFTQLCKYDGEKTAVLSARDFHQISGRAGRKGFDDSGVVVAQAPAHMIENLRLAAKKTQGKKVVMQKPPEKGYVPWDKATFDRLVDRAPEAMESRFEVSHGMIMLLLQNPLGGYDRLVTLIARSHGNAGHKRRQRRAAAVLFRGLRRAGLIIVTRRKPPRKGATVEISADLQRDFSLNHTLAMYLLDTLPKLDRMAPSYALDVLSLVEAILENPQVVLWAQLDRLKTETMQALKAEGMEFEQRIEALDKLEYPKPLREFIYDTFNEFSAHHPWVGTENIRPKSIARDMFERFATFHDYVREYGLQRSEGVLLRYLSDAYKTLAQTVPIEARSDELEDVLSHLRLELGSVDASLLEEWEGKRDGVIPVRRVGAPVEVAAPTVSPARIRAELHRLLMALGRGRWEEALSFLWKPEDGGWTIDSLKAAMVAYHAEHKNVDLRPQARRPQFSVIKKTGTSQWEALQKIVDPDEKQPEPDANSEAETDEVADWILDCVVDLQDPKGERAVDAPLLSLRGIRNG